VQSSDGLALLVLAVDNCLEKMIPLSEKSKFLSQIHFAAEERFYSFISFGL
jgi:hypothetical protein